MSIDIENNIGETKALFNCWLKEQGTVESYSWLQSKIKEISSGDSKSLFIAYSSASRHYKKQKLNLSESEFNQFPSEDCNLDNWTLDRIARSVLLLSFPSEDADNYVTTLNQIISAADVEEAIAFYQSLPLLPHPEKFRLRAAEGIRTNMTSVFNAVAHYNSYPAKYLDELAWNQMILKALFVDSPLHPIYGLKQRNNPQLAQMLVDYAHERLAANRTVSSELWELVRPFQPEVVAKINQD